MSFIMPNPPTSGGGGGTPGGPDGAVQFNSTPGGIFAGSGDFLFDQVGFNLRLGSTVANPYTLSPLPQSIINAVGVALTVGGGTGNGTGAGGALNVVAGAAGAAGVLGGQLNLRGGNSPQGVGGNVEIFSGIGNAIQSTGAVTLASNQSGGAGGSGQVFIRSGPVASTTGTNQTGNVTIATGVHSATSGIGGTGTLSLQTGSGRNPGQIELIGGSVSGGTGAGGAIVITAGSAQVGGTGGSITLMPGGGGTPGRVIIAGGIFYGGNARRIEGNFYDATLANRLLFKSNETVILNQPTDVGAIPAGTASLSYWTAYNNSAPANSGLARMGVDTTAAYLDSTRAGSGTALNLRFRAGNAPTVAGVMYATGNWSFGTATAETAGAERVQIGGSLSISDATLIRTYTNFADGAGTDIGTLLNAPLAGNPTKWVPFNDNGVIRHFPAW